MEPDIKSLLEENLTLNRENNKLIKKVYHIQRWAQITRYAYWFIILGIALGAFYFVKPFLGNILNIYTGGNSSFTSVKDVGKNIPDVNKLQELVKDLNQ